MAAQRGRMMLIQIGNGASPASYTTVGGLRTKSLTVNNETVDITTSDEAPWRTLGNDMGLRSMSITGGGVFKDDAAFNSVENLALNGNPEDFKVLFDNNDYFIGQFVVTSLEYAGDHNNEQSYSITLESAGHFELVRG